MDELKEKDLLFHFLESLYEKQMDNSSVNEIEKRLFEKLDMLKKEKQIKNTDFESITDLIYELRGEIKYRYFIYGILAGNIIDEFSG